MAGDLAPALGMIELSSIAQGVVAGDAMVKTAPIATIHAGTVHPGRYLVLVGGDTASVEIALDVGRTAGAETLVDSMFLPDVHADVVAAIVSGADAGESAGEAIGIVEASSVASIIDAADAAVKTAAVTLAAVRLADGLGGKGYLIVGGVVAEVEAAIDAAVDRAQPGGRLVGSVIIPQIADEMRANLAADLRFNRGLRLSPLEVDR